MRELFHSKNAHSFGTWLGILTAGYALAGKLTPEWFGQLSWPQLALGAFGAAVGTLFLLAVSAFLIGAGGALFRRYKPLPNEGSKSAAAGNDDTGLRGKVDSLEQVLSAATAELQLLKGIPDRVDELERLTRAIAQVRGNMDTVETRLEGALDGLKEHVRSEDESLRMYLDALQERITELKELIGTQQEALLAIYHRERMLALAKVINEQSMELAVPLANGKVMDDDEWETWKRERLQWEATVHQWAQYASLYLGREPMDDVRRINSEGLDENWGAKADQFPSSDPEGLRVYKTFRIYLRNYANISDIVHQRVRRKAFEGLSV